MKLLESGDYVIKKECEANNFGINMRKYSMCNFDTFECVKSIWVNVEIDNMFKRFWKRVNKCIGQD